MRKAVRITTLLLLVGGLGGCAGTRVHDGTQKESTVVNQLRQENPVHQLTAPTYFEQKVNHCGPAALAMAMADLGYAVTPEQTAPLTFLPGRSGSLPLELMAAARRLGAFAAPIPPRLGALLTEVANGHSPIVLLNLGLSWAPAWHYATVTGYNLNEGTITLRSGLNAKQQMALFTFGHVWGRAKRWAISVHRPGRLPITATRHSLVKAALAFERVNTAVPALATWQSIVTRWPHDKTSQIGLGNQAYATGALRQAKSAFQHAARLDSGSTAAWNNLAVVLTALGEFEAADKALAQVSALPTGNNRRVAATRAALRRAKSRAGQTR